MPIVTIYHRNGEIRELRPIENGMINGVVKRYSEDGKLVREIPYVDGVKQGVKKQYYPDGTIKAEIPYIDGSVHGIKRKFNKYGLLFESIQYGNGEYVKQCFYDPYFAAGLTEEEKKTKQRHEENFRIAHETFLKDSAEVLNEYGAFDNPKQIRSNVYKKFPLPDDVELADIVSSVKIEFATDELFTESSVGTCLTISNGNQILAQYERIELGERELLSRQISFNDWQHFIDVLFNKAFCHEWAQAYYDKTDHLGYFPCNEDWGFLKINFKQPSFGYQKTATYWSRKEPPFWNLVLEEVQSLVEIIKGNEPIKQEKQVRENTFVKHLIKNCSPNEFVDERDGNIYKTVKIGNQIWMAENLAYKTPNAKYFGEEVREGDGDLQDNHTEWGYFYFYDEATTIACPTGWHLPSNSEWGSAVSYYTDNYDNAESAINALEILGSGYYENGWELDENPLPTFWTSNSTPNAPFFNLGNNSFVSSYSVSDELAMNSIRCVQD